MKKRNITAYSAPHNKKCRYCKEEIPRDASRCSHCQGQQNRFLEYVGIPVVANIISILMLLFAVRQACEAHEASVQARQARQDVERIAKYVARGFYATEQARLFLAGTGSEESFKAMQHVADELLDSLNLTPAEREEIRGYKGVPSQAVSNVSHSTHE